MLLWGVNKMENGAPNGNQRSVSVGEKEERL